jgi:predicted Zn finger-like uncharacterized protein
MRLVCEKCTAIYTIEDGLVGDRDFRVSCKQCGTPIVVRHERPPAPSSSGTQITPSVESLPSELARRPYRPPASFAPTGQEEWFVWLAGKQKGPFRASQLAQLLEQGEMEWTTQVWREGFKDWRAARRDATLVTAVAGVRGGGGAGDTMRLNAARSFLAPEDTIVEARPNIFASSSQRVSVVSKDDLLSSTSDTQAIDARELPAATEPIRTNPQGGPPPQWHSPENAAFRAGLGLPQDSRENQVRIPARASSSSAAPSRSEAFRSAPTLMGGRSQPQSTTDTLSDVGGETWLPKPRSLLMVAAIAFGGGVLAAAIATRYVPHHQSPAITQLKGGESTRAASEHPKVTPGPSPTAKPSTPPPAAPPTQVAPGVPDAPQTQPAIQPVLRELPTPEELRSEVRRVAPDVRRCITDPTTGVEVGVFIDGASGRVREIDVRSARLPPGRVDCVIHAVKQIQLAPFKRTELRLEHKFSW